MAEGPAFVERYKKCFGYAPVLNAPFAYDVVGVIVDAMKRAVILSAAPSLEAGEITDKGYVNQRAVLTLRADKVQRLFSADDSVIVIA